MNSPNIYHSPNDKYIRDILPVVYHNNENLFHIPTSNDDWLTYHNSKVLLSFDVPLKQFLPIQQLVVERPVKYFFQKPLLLSDDNISTRKKKQIHEMKKHNKYIENIVSNARWAKPVKMQDVLCNPYSYHNSNSRVYKPSELVKIKNEIREKLEKEKEQIQLQKYLEKQIKEKREKLRYRNRRYWNLLSKFRYVLKYFKALKDFTSVSKKFTRNKNSINQSFEIDSLILTNFIRNSINSLEDLITNNFSQRFIIDLNNQSKTDDSIFRIKTFIHQIFYDLSKSFSKETITKNIKETLRKYISNGAQLPYDFLSTFEFNRLEFDINMKLTNMTIDKQAMLIGFILLYRILLKEIFINYQNYFQKLSNVNPLTKMSRSSDDDIRRRILGITNLTNENIEENIKFNFSFLCIVLNAIFKNVFLNSPKIYIEHFKENHVYKQYVIDGGISKSYISNRIQNDSLEFAQKFPKNDLADEFLKQQKKWINMHQITVLSLCINLVETILN